MTRPPGQGPSSTPPPDQPSAEDDVSIVSRGAVTPGPGGAIDADAVRRALEATDPDDADDAPLAHVSFHLRRDLRKRLDRYLTDRITFMSRTALQRLIEGGGVQVNGRAPKASTVLRAGDRVDVVIPQPPPKNIQPEDIPLDILFEDEHLIVLNKRPDIIVHPARSHLKGTLLSALEFHFRHRSPFAGSALSAVGDEFARPGVVHRLDRHTSGCIVFAKQDEAHWKLAAQFERRTVEKRYLAVTQGRVEPAGDAIDLPIGPHPSREKGLREKYVVRHDDLGRPSLTLARVREWYTLPGSNTPQRPVRYSLVELELKTGRTHQIRIHLSHLGFPIVGDDMYGGRPYPPDTQPPIIARQALHAALLAFSHPITGEPLRFTAPLRGDMADLVRHLRAHAAVQRPEVPGCVIDLDFSLGTSA